MIVIRPHHILCMRAYQGNGYSEEFNLNIKKTIKEIDLYNVLYNKEPDINMDTNIKLVFGLDSLCKYCPNNLGKVCTSQDNITYLDRKVIEIFNLDEGIYSYKELESKVYKNMNNDYFDQICGKCEWSKKMNCRNLIVSQSK